MGVKKAVKRTEYQVDDGVLATAAKTEFILEAELKGRSSSTLRNYEQSIRYFFEFLQIKPYSTVNSFTKSSLLTWINTMKQANTKPSTINHYLRDVRTFLYWCMDEEREYIPPFKISQIKTQEEPPKAFNDEDIDSLLEKPRRNDSFSRWRTWAIVNWIMATGNRSSTICEIRAVDVDYKRKEIYLRHTKNARYQRIPLSEALEDVLREYTSIWSIGHTEDDFLFPNSDLNKLTTNNLRRSFSTYCHERGVQQTNIHGLRHSFAIGSIRNGCSISKLQCILGHSTIDMTSRYIRFSTEDLKEGYESFSPLDNRLSKPTKSDPTKRRITRR